MVQTNTPIPTEREQAFLEAIEIADSYRCVPKGPVHRGQDNTARLISEDIRTAMSTPLDPVPIDFEDDEGIPG